MLLWFLLLQLDDAPGREPSQECEFGSGLSESEPCPATNPGSWIQNQDYPPSSLRNAEQGDVGFTLEVDQNGVATDCSVDEPSSWPTLNEATCRLLLERARFIPLQNEAGENIAGQYSSAVRWQIPDGSEVENWIIPRVIDVTLTIGRSGEVIDCDVHQLESAAAIALGGYQPTPEEYCEYMKNTGRMPIVPGEEENFPQRFRFQNSVVPEPQP